MKRDRHNALMLGLSLGLLALVVSSLFLGLNGFAKGTRDIIMHYRGTRIMLAIIAGSSLAASGASLQAIFRNPLADPHIFGISGGAALGASIVIAFLAEHAFMPSAGAIIGGLAAFIVLFYYLHRSPAGSLSQCLIVGVLINATAAALITILKTSLPAQKTQTLLFWLVGHISVVDPISFFVIVPLWLVGMFGLLSIRGELELLSFGVDESRLLGINADRMFRIAIAANCLLIGNVVAFAGMIGFLGLVIPHLVRHLVSTDQFVVVPISAFLGAILLVFFDTLSRLSFFLLDTELPVGALSALILSPAFFFLLLREQRHG
jgi:iron complex transport system permease protein